jgi:type I restriction enzyme S subunit
MAKENDVLMSVRAPVGDLNIATCDLCIGRGLSAITSKNGDNEFLYYSLKYNIQNLLRQGSGTTYSSVNKDIINDFDLIVPKEENNWQYISRLLSSLDAKIELNNKINKELEAMAKTLYDYWFVQFDFPNESGKPYKSSGGAMVYSQELKREIPKGWEVKTISELIGNNKGGDWGKANLEGNYTQKVSCVRGADLNGLNGLGELNPPERFILEKNSNKTLEPNDLIVEISGGSPTQSTGRLAFMIEETLNRFNNPVICSNFCKSFSLKDSKLLYFFVYTWSMLYDNNVFFGWEGKTSGIKNLLFDSFTEKYHVVIPDEKTNNKFYEKVKTIHKMKQKNLQQNQELSKIRDWLLPMLMNGQVQVK